MILLKVTYFSLGAIIYSIFSHSLTLRLLHVIILLSRRRCMYYKPRVPLTGGVGFYSNVLIVPKCTGRSQPILNIKQFNHYMYIHTFKMLTIRKVHNLFNKLIKFFLLILRTLISIFLSLSVTIIFTFCLAKYTLPVEGFAIWVDHGPKGFHFTY